MMTVALFMAVGFTSCGDSDESETWVTYYPVLTLDGSTYEMHTMGQPFVDPGYTATLDGQDITDQVVVTTDMDINKPGMYAINYTVANSEGFSASAVRYVIVADANDPASGIYYTDPNSYRLYNGATVYFGASYQILVIGNGDGTYEVDDMIGGWYCQRAGYGSNYAMQGEIEIAADGAVTLLDSWVPGWGDAANELTDGHFDKDSNTLHWDVSYTDYPFDFVVTMTKQ